MADKTLPALDPVSAPLATDILLTRQAADTEDRRYTRAQIYALISGEHFILPIVNEPGTPTWAFGDGTFGFYSNINDVIHLGLADSSAYSWTAAQFAVAAASGPSVRNLNSTELIPGFVPNKADLDSGVGWGPATDMTGLVAGGRAGFFVRELDAGVVQVPAASLVITAFSGGGQGSAFPMINTYNLVATVAAAGDSVRLPAVFSVNALIIVANSGAFACDIFPASGDDIGAGTNVAISLAPGLSVAFIATVADTTWDQIFGLQGTQYTTQGNFVTAAPGFDAITADNVSQTQASGTLIQSSRVTLISLNANDSATLPSVFPVNTIIEIAMPDVDEDDVAAVIFPALGDDLGEGTNLGLTLLPHTSVVFRAVTANATWEQTPMVATQLKGLKTSGPLIRDITAEQDAPSLCPRADQPGDGVGSSNPGEIGFSASSLLADKFVALGGGTMHVTDDRQKAVTAFATGGQTNAVVLLNTFNIVTVVASAGDSVKFPLLFSQYSIVEVTNLDSTEAMDLFPGLGDDLGQGTNVALSVLAGETVRFIALVANTTWHQINNV